MNGYRPEVVAKVVERVVTSPQPSACYLVGKDVHVMAAIARVLPDRARDGVLRNMMKLISR